MAGRVETKVRRLGGANHAQDAVAAVPSEVVGLSVEVATGD